MNSRNATWMGLFGLAVSVGCSARTMIGEVPPDGSAPDGGNPALLDPVGTSGHTCAPPQFAGDHPFDFPAGVEGVWTGYVEGGTLGLASDAVRLTLDHAADGTSQIHIAYGVAAPPPPATSATELPPGYPDFGKPYVIEGFPYTAHNVNWQAFGQQWRLRFLINNQEPWASWCQLQPSYATPYEGGITYDCLPNTGGRSVGSPLADGGRECYVFGSPGTEKPVSCAQLDLCAGNRTCACDECGCGMPGISYDGVPSGPGSYDILFDASAANGSSLRLMRAAS